MRKTALITGTSSGLGMEFARIYAREGYDLVVIARSEGKLYRLKSELEAQYGCHVWVFAQDLSQPDAAYEVFNYALEQNITIDVLVNNAGFGDFGNFWEVDAQRQTKLLQVNIVSLVQLTRYFLPGMVERRRGSVLNLSSVAAFSAGSRMCLYYAPKEFVRSFSEAIAEEVRGTGVTVTALCPGPTATGFEQAAQMKILHVQACQRHSRRGSGLSGHTERQGTLLLWLVYPCGKYCRTAAAEERVSEVYEEGQRIEKGIFTFIKTIPLRQLRCFTNKHKSGLLRQAVLLFKEAFNMATTRLMPLHTGKGRTVGQAISDIIDYTENPQKTDGGKLITSWQCDSRIADAEFLFTKNQYIQKTGRVRGEDDVIAYHLRQSFVPGEITPEEANRLGCELAKRFTKGNHAYIVCTHIDKAHIHNHVIWNSTALSQTRKFRNFWGSSRAVRRLNDTICIENGYSIVENPKRHGKSYNKWLGDKKKPSHRERICTAIDDALAQKPDSFEALLELLRQAGYEVKGKKVPSLLGGEQKKSIRMDTLGDGYTPADLRMVIAGEKEHLRGFKRA